jgi:hypothetical protein
MRLVIRHTMTKTGRANAARVCVCGDGG